MKWGIRRFQNKDGSYTNAGKKRYAEKPKSQLERDVETRLDKEKLSKAGYKLDVGRYGCYAEKDINGVSVSIVLDKYDDKSNEYRLVDDPDSIIKTAEKFANDKNTPAILSKAKDRFYDTHKDYMDENVTKEEFRSRVDSPHISIDPQNNICSLSYDDDGIFGRHIPGMIINMSSGEVEEFSLDG